MSLVGFKAQNHRQQTGRRGARPEVDDRAVPPEWFAELHERFRFSIDVAASAENTKCSRYFDKTTDGLKQSWAGERVWCNPPYSDLTPWLEKAWQEFGAGAELIVMLVPANRTEQAWWQEWVEPMRDKPEEDLRVEFLRGRRRFIAPNAAAVGPNERPPFGVCLLVWERDVTAIDMPEAANG